jgi:hypothetical protein
MTSITLCIAFDWKFCCLSVPKSLFSIAGRFIVSMMVFNGTHRRRSHSSSEYYAQVIGNYLSPADDILFHKNFNPLKPELNPSAQGCMPRFFTGILIFKGLTARRLYKSFGFNP